MLFITSSIFYNNGGSMLLSALKLLQSDKFLILLNHLTLNHLTLPVKNTFYRLIRR